MASAALLRSSATLHVAHASCSKPSICEIHSPALLKPTAWRHNLLQLPCYKSIPSKRSWLYIQSDFKRRHKCRCKAQAPKNPQQSQAAERNPERFLGKDDDRDAWPGGDRRNKSSQDSSTSSQSSNGVNVEFASEDGRYIEIDSNADPDQQEGGERRHYTDKRPYPGRRRQVNVADFEDPADAVDALWSMLPIDQLRREGEVGWDVSPEGPVGPERFDNVFGNVQQTSNADAINTIGMGTWRLKASVSQLIVDLVKNIEGGWRHFIDDLGLYGLDRRWLYLDSLDPKQEYGQWSYKDLESPKSRQDPKWPRLQIENRCYQSDAFRKLHMEVAHRQDGLEIFHCVMYPRVEYDLPILSIDVVAKDEVVSLGIIDPCPVTMDRTLPPAYTQIASELQEIYGVQSNREIPDWGEQIFSDQCIIVRPEDAEDFDAFFSYLIAMVRVHLRLANATNPIPETDNLEDRSLQIREANIRYCEQQLRNNKTKRVLAAAFSEELAEQYMQEVMFDMAEIKSQPARSENGARIDAV